MRDFQKTSESLQFLGTKELDSLWASQIQSQISPNTQGVKALHSLCETCTPRPWGRTLCCSVYHTCALLLTPQIVHSLRVSVLFPHLLSVVLAIMAIIKLFIIWRNISAKKELLYLSKIATMFCKDPIKMNHKKIWTNWVWTKLDFGQLRKQLLISRKYSTCRLLCVLNFCS